MSWPIRRFIKRHILEDDQWSILWVSVCYLCNPDGEGAGGEQAEEPDQRLREVLHQHGEQGQAAEHHRQHGAHSAGKLGLLK